MEVKNFTFDEISEIPDDSLLPWLDQKQVDEQNLNSHLLSWRRNGVLWLDNFIPWDLIEAYKECWLKNNEGRLGGWPDCTPYLRHPEIKNLGLYPPLMDKLKELIGTDMGMHLNLTGWVSTQRNWHQDDYLNPTGVNCWYAAVWIALEDISARSGPFQWVEGSHRWPLTRRELLFKHIPETWHHDPRWPSLTQEKVSHAFEAEIGKRKSEIHVFNALKGDVLIWHGRLAHRGSEPRDKSILRKSFISHYSALSHRPDMPWRQEHSPGCWYFDFKDSVNGTV